MYVKQINKFRISVNKNGVYTVTFPNGVKVYRTDKLEKAIQFVKLSCKKRADVNKKEYRATKIANGKAENDSSIAVRNKMLNCNETLLFHGSNGGIQCDIKCDVNKGLCDFGNGFYTGNDLRQAENRVANVAHPIVYAFKADTKGLSVYEFKNAVTWALYVGYNRGKFDNTLDRYPKLVKLVEEISRHDVIIGWIADDKIAKCFNDFLNNNINARALADSLKCVSYGKQVVFKTDKACKRLDIVGDYKVTAAIREQSTEWNRGVKENMDAKLEEIKLKHLGEGGFLSQIMEEFK